MTREEAREALEALWQPFKDIEFVSSASRSVHLAAILTAIIRQDLPTAPGFLYAGPKGSGKSLLVKYVAALTTTGRIVTIPKGKQNGKAVQRQLLLAENKDSVILENVGEGFRSDSLVGWLSKELYTGRVRNTTVVVPTKNLILLTGKNTELHKDLEARILTCCIDLPEETTSTKKLYAKDIAVIKKAGRVLMEYASEYPATYAGHMVIYKKWCNAVVKAVNEATTLNEAFGVWL